MQGTLRGLGCIQQSRFIRHAASKFLKSSCKDVLGADVNTVALSVDKFRQVLDHITEYGAAVHKGVGPPSDHKFGQVLDYEQALVR